MNYHGTQLMCSIINSSTSFALDYTTTGLQLLLAGFVLV